MAAHRVLSTPEIISIIFEHSEKNQNTTNAQVCRIWSEEALNLLWRDVKGPWQLFSPLDLQPPKYLSYNLSIRLSRPLEPEDWERFYHYSPRVRTLDLSSKSNYDSSFFSTINLTRPPTPLLPNLRTMYFTSLDPEYLLIFLGPNLFKLTWHMGFRLSEPSFIMAFRYLPSRTPNLTHLSLISTVDYSVNLAAAVIEVISLLRCLKTFQAPNSLLTSDITSALFSLPSLETIQVVQAHASNDKGAYLPTKYNADEQQFSSLQKLQLDIPFGRFVDWLSLIRSHRSLSIIKINSTIPQTSDQYRTLICACVKTCPALQVLHLTVEHPTPTEDDSFNFSHIEPLLQCSGLKEFHIQHYLSLEITSNQLCYLVEQLCCIEVLSLNPSPNAGSRVGSSLMDLSALQTMVPYCPNLTKLSLLVNGASVPKPTLQLHGGFPKLKSLDLGCSPCGSVDQLAAFLSAVLPSGCKITGDRSKWETVGKFMPTFHQVRMEERLRLSLTASS